MTTTLPLETIRPILSSICKKSITTELIEILTQTAQKVIDKKPFYTDFEIETYKQIRDVLKYISKSDFFSDREIIANEQLNKFDSSPSFSGMKKLKKSLYILKKFESKSLLINKIEDSLQSKSKEAIENSLQKHLVSFAKKSPFSLQEKQARTLQIKDFAKAANINLADFNIKSILVFNPLLTLNSSYVSAEKILSFSYFDVIEKKITDIIAKGQSIDIDLYIELYEYVKLIEYKGYTIKEISSVEIIEKLEALVHADICSNIDKALELYNDKSYFDTYLYIKDFIGVMPPQRVYKKSLVGFNYNGVTLTENDLTALLFASIVKLDNELVRKKHDKKEGIDTSLFRSGIYDFFARDLSWFNCHQSLKNQYLKSIFILLINKVAELPINKQGFALYEIGKGFENLPFHTKEYTLEDIGLNSQILDLMDNFANNKTTAEMILQLLPKDIIPFDIKYKMQKSMLFSRMNLKL